MIFSTPVNNEPLTSYYRSLVKGLVTLPPLEGVALLPVDADSFQPQVLADSSIINIGVYLPENGMISPAVLKPSFAWDLLIVPSNWLEYQLKVRGITSVITVSPGYDMPPSGNKLARFKDKRFIVASSGAVTLQQGHDLVLAAMARFIAFHDDCYFSCNWQLTSEKLARLNKSPHCRLDGCSPWDLPGLLSRHGIPPNRIFKSAVDSSDAADAAWALAATADILLAPARVMLGDDTTCAAFHAAGKPIISFKPFDSEPQLAPDGTTVWFETSLTDILASMEVSYNLWRAGCASSPPSGLRQWSAAAGELHQAATRLYAKHFSENHQPVSAFTCNKRGAALAALGLYDAAHENYRHAVTLEPLNPETYNCLGNLMDIQGRYQEALLYFNKATGIDCHFTAAFFNKATTLQQQERLDEAIEAYLQAIGIDPGFVMGWLHLAVAHALNNQDDKADDCFRRTIELDPDNTDALFLWGNQLLNKGAFIEAINCYQRAISIDPHHFLAYNSIGIAYLSLSESSKAYDALQSALLIKPDMTTAMTNIGTACRDMDRLDEAVAWFRRALQIEPEDADTHWNLALALLHQGNYTQGWQEYEWRFKKSEKIIIPDRAIPLWQGEPLAGKTILMQAEQGYGDTIQFVRYAPAVASQGCRVIIECQDDNVKSVVRFVPGVSAAIGRNESLQADFKIPLMSLPYMFGTSPETIPYTFAYITPPGERIIYWQDMVSRHTPADSLRVGIVWDGRKTFRNDKRSVPIEKLTKLFDVGGITFVSLQKGEQSEQLKPYQKRFPIIDLTSKLTDFADTAALIAGLDLVLSVDTSVAHLAGALGCPTWVMLKIGPDWRWLENRKDSPWYSSVTLFRQSLDGIWDDVIEQIFRCLKQLKCQHKKRAKVYPADVDKKITHHY